MHEPVDEELRRFRLHQAVALGFGGAAVLFTACLVLAVMVLHAFELVSCAVSGAESNFGRRQWSVLPPGPQCVFTEEANGFDATRGPGWRWSAYLVADAVLVVVAASSTVQLLRMRPTFGDASARRQVALDVGVRGGGGQ